jgi:hypothetical protein
MSVFILRLDGSIKNRADYPPTHLINNMKKIIYWLFDSENKDLNEFIEYQLDYLGKQKHIIEFFKTINI